MINKSKLISNILPVLYMLFAFLSIHTINNFYFYVFSFLITFYFLYRGYIKLSCSIFLTTLFLMPTWLLFNNLFFEKVNHYTILSDVFTAFILSILFNSINSSREKKFNLFAASMMFMVFSFFKYYAYDSFLYWGSIIIIIICGLNFFHMQYTRMQNKNIQILLFCLYIFVLTMSLYNIFEEKNSSKIGILKSDWCNISNTPPKNNYEIKYYYAYSDFVNILNSYGVVQGINNQEIISQASQFNTIILITPTTPINSEQVKTLYNFVKNGGRLILITDHTNLYGHIDSVAGLVSAFGIKLNDDSVFNPNNYYENAILNTNSPKYKSIMMKTGNSIIPPPNARVWAITHKLISEKADYTKENFFSEMLFSSDDNVGSFPIGITVKKGKGDFVIWNDSTLFSNFAINQKGNIELLDYIIKNKIYKSKDRKTNYKLIKILSDNHDTFWEAPPNMPPSDIHFSTLIANFTRVNLFPEFVQTLSNDTILFTTYENLQRNFYRINTNKIVIVDDIPSNNFLGVKKYDFDTKKVTNSNDNFYYSVKGNSISLRYKYKNIVLAKNVLSDNELGTWWNITPISPYKKEMINQFLEWVQKNDEISIFKYPSFKCINKSYMVKYDNGKEDMWDTICMSKIIKSDNNNLVYLGKRKWAFVIDKNVYFGNPELSDNYLSTLNTKWTAKVANKKKIKKMQSNKGCPLNRFNIGTKHAIP